MKKNKDGETAEQIEVKLWDYQEHPEKASEFNLTPADVQRKLSDWQRMKNKKKPGFWRGPYPPYPPPINQ